MRDKLLKRCVVVDIETSSQYDIKSEFDKYVADAKCKWFGAYSYITNKYYKLQVKGKEKVIQDFLNQHDTIITFNGDDFDIPILKNNKLWSKKYMNSIDLKVVLGNGIGLKNRGSLMGFKFRRNSLKEIATQMKLFKQKGEIDYDIFKKESWNEKEIEEIKHYLHLDVEVTKLMFDKVFDYWFEFTNFVSEKNVNNWSWIKSKSGALSYKVLCFFAGLEELYSDEETEKENVGGLVLDPIADELKNIWYYDFSSLYPCIMIMFNIFGNPSLIKESKKWFTGNDIFKIKGKYDISEHHILSKKFIEMFVERKRIKKSNPAKAFAYKIILNGAYGVLRSKKFLATYYEHSGADICRIGQKMNLLIGEFFEKYGFETVFGDTDSRGFRYIGEKELSIEEQYELCNKIKNELLEYIKQNVPFPFDEFDLESETGDKPVKYMMFVPDEKTGDYKKKNYCYIYYDKEELKVKIVGLPVKKNNATKLSIKIFRDHIEPRMKKELTGKFEAKWIRELIYEELNKDLTLAFIEYSVKAFKSYSLGGRGCIGAQISNGYLNGKSGLISLVKNRKVGNVGKDWKYCTLEEAKDLKIDDLDLTKIFNELQPFCKDKLSYKDVVVTKGFF